MNNTIKFAGLAMAGVLALGGGVAGGFVGGRHYEREQSSISFADEKTQLQNQIEQLKKDLKSKEADYLSQLNERDSQLAQKDKDLQQKNEDLVLKEKELEEMQSQIDELEQRLSELQGPPIEPEEALPKIFEDFDLLNNVGTTELSLTKYLSTYDFSRDYVWTDIVDNKVYYTSGDHISLEWVAESQTWKEKTWDIDGSFDGRSVWNDGRNSYYSKGAKHLSLKGDTWSQVSWSGLDNFDGENVFNFKGETFCFVNEKLFKLTSGTWNQVEMTGDSIDKWGRVWSDGENLYNFPSGNTINVSSDGVEWKTMQIGGEELADLTYDHTFIYKGYLIGITDSGQMFGIYNNKWCAIKTFDSSDALKILRGVWTDGFNVYVTELSEGEERDGNVTVTITTQKFERNPARDYFGSIS